MYLIDDYDVFCTDRCSFFVDFFVLVVSFFRIFFVSAFNFYAFFVVYTVFF